jgi:hypothetical protein
MLKDEFDAAQGFSLLKNAMFLTKERMSFTAHPPFKREKQAKTTRNSSVS